MPPSLVDNRNLQFSHNIKHEAVLRHSRRRCECSLDAAPGIWRSGEIVLLFVWSKIRDANLILFHPSILHYQIWCPPDNCEIYTNPYGYAGADSSFFKCYNPVTDETTDGVWTGSLSDTSAPEGYVEPEMCTGSEYSECNTDDDCSLAISPSCVCFVSSWTVHVCLSFWQLDSSSLEFQQKTR